VSFRPRRAGRPRDYCGPATPGSPFELPGLGSSDFARHYFRNHGCFLFLQVLRWFTSLGSPRAAMNLLHDDRCSHRPGFPIRISPDLGVLATPRGFSQLAASFIAYLRQGIHTHALSSLTIKLILDTECLMRLTPPPSPGSRLTTGRPASILQPAARLSPHIRPPDFRLTARRRLPPHDRPPGFRHAIRRPAPASRHGGNL
jgi:hypothetical protein